MFDFVKKLLIARQFTMEKGQITLTNLPVMILPVYVVVNMQKALEKSMGFEKTKKFIYEGTKKGSIEHAREINKRYGLKGKQLVDFLINYLTMAGWGEVNLVNIDIKNKTAVTHFSNSTFSKYYGFSKNPVDHIMAGSQAGGATVVFGEDADVIETKCVAMGSPYCEFIYKVKSKK